MKVIKWETIIKNAECIIGTLGAGCWTTNSISMAAQLQFVEQLITKELVKSWRENAKEITKKAQAICRNWDIRRAKALLDVFPQLIPKKYQGKIPMADYDAKGNWVLIFAED